jgi:CubicO group peptidase (beta-lactamase class C family)
MARPDTSELTDDKILELNRYISRTMQKSGVPALSITIAQHGKTIFSRGYGRRDLESGKRATKDTLYGVGSVTKSVTSMCILLLEKQGLLKTSAPVTDYLDDYRVDEYAGKTTLSNLMYHSSGIASVNAAEIVLFRDLGRDTTNIPLETMDDFMDFINGAASERHSLPGKKFMYWNEGYTLLGRVIEGITGKPYAQCVREMLLKPLDMKRSTFSGMEAFGDSDHATPYIRKDGELVPAGISDHETVLAPGGLITSSEELSRYVSLWTGGNGGIFDAGLLKESVKPRFTVDSTGPYGKSHYGYGWSIQDDFLGHRIVQHSGAVGASSGFVGFLEDFGVSVSIGANVSESPNSRIGFYALSLFVRGSGPEDLPFVKHDKLKEELIGMYGDYRDFSFLIIKESSTGNLTFELRSDEYNISVPVLMDGDEVFIYMDNEKMPLEIRKSKDNKVEIFLERHRFVKK